jgi:hypothetical protein
MEAIRNRWERKLADVYLEQQTKKKEYDIYEMNILRVSSKNDHFFVRLQSNFVRKNSFEYPSSQLRWWRRFCHKKSVWVILDLEAIVG